MAVPDPVAALEALARSRTWAEAKHLYREIVGRATDRAEEDAAFRAASEQGWALTAIPEMRLVIGAWFALTRLEEDAEAARTIRDHGRAKLGKDGADWEPMDYAQIGSTASKANDSAIRAEGEAIRARAAIVKLLQTWRRAALVFREREIVRLPDGTARFKRWDEYGTELLQLTLAEGDLQMALTLSARCASPAAVTPDDLAPLAQAQRSHLALIEARDRAIIAGDSAALVAITPALALAADRHQRLLDPGAVDGSDDIRAAEQAVADDISRGRA